MLKRIVETVNVDTNRPEVLKATSTSLTVSPFASWTNSVIMQALYNFTDFHSAIPVWVGFD